MSQLVFAGHPKASLVWHQYVYGRFCKELNLSIQWVTRLSDSKKYLDENKCDFLFYKSSTGSQIMEDMIGFHIYRNPRDMLVSGYYSSKFSHPADNHPVLQEHRKKLHQVNMEEGLILEMDYLNDYFNDMRGWCWDNTNILNIPMEELFSSPAEILLNTIKIARHMGFLKGYGYERPTYLTEATITRTLDDYSFENLTKRKKGEEDSKHHFRKGTPNDWKNHWTDKVDKEFTARYGDIIAEYDYDKD